MTNPTVFNYKFIQFSLVNSFQILDDNKIDKRVEKNH